MLSPIYLDPLFVLVGAWFGWRHGCQLQANGVRLKGQLKLRQVPLLSAIALIFIFGNTLMSVVVNNRALNWYVPSDILFYDPIFRLLANQLLSGFLFVAIAAIARRESHLAFTSTIMLSLIVIVGIDVYPRYMLRPIEINTEKTDRDGVIIQSTGDSCAAASGANIARLLGVKDATEASMARLMATTNQGTTDAGIIHAMRKTGLKVNKRSIPSRDLTQLTPPALLLVDLPMQQEAHCIMFAGMKDDGKAEIWDPLVGRVCVDLEMIKERWPGHAFEVSKKE